MGFLNSQLTSNKDRIQVEKDSLDRLNNSFSTISDTFKNQLEA